MPTSRTRARRAGWTTPKATAPRGRRELRAAATGLVTPASVVLRKRDARGGQIHGNRATILDRGRHAGDRAVGQAQGRGGGGGDHLQLLGRPGQALRRLLARQLLGEGDL